MRGVGAVVPFLCSNGFYADCFEVRSLIESLAYNLSDTGP